MYLNGFWSLVRATKQASISSLLHVVINVLSYCWLVPTFSFMAYLMISRTASLSNFVWNFKKILNSFWQWIDLNGNCQNLDKIKESCFSAMFTLIYHEPYLPILNGLYHLLTSFFYFLNYFHVFQGLFGNLSILY